MIFSRSFMGRGCWNRRRESMCLRRADAELAGGGGRRRWRSLRRTDGGYAKGAEGAASSTYHTFLVLLCQQLIGQERGSRRESSRFSVTAV